jgi:hypothetical protein
MRFRPANIRLINRRSNLPRLLLALSPEDGKNNDNYKNNPTDAQELTGSLHIRACLINGFVKGHDFSRAEKGSRIQGF